ncbi:DUF2079 domain-containing protein [Phytohabitans sp. ZYX-F-186]|uniref:DUF2079 domain-containing protein n=1 Tax=Phytohabitans maris TaxID=3071409 RepID=A0ABU0ZFQ0_9ACTN|nr:DUF2079 domain-containing protein [Phytohabitans sp. ZYX-F-186]MDQ7905892.1 DUF2079 domain-containing protein [Phytohabitans sp. ZYX-F-186]
MTLTEPVAAPADPPAPSRRRPDLVVAALALGLAVLVTAGLWADPDHRTIKVNSSDQALFEWLLAYGAHALTHAENPLFTHLMNVPDGVNLAVNTSITVYAIVFAPLTLLAGPQWSFVVILTLNLAATAFAWYLLLSRVFRLPVLASAVGGLFCGFAPGMVSHANAHLNWTAGWLVPLLVWRVFALREPGRWRRNGLILGVLVAVAFSIAAEGLFFTALACAVFLGVWAFAQRAEARAALPSFVRGLALTGGVALVLLSYPLWLHFLGPQRFHGTGFDPNVHNEDLAAFAAFPERSLAGAAGLETGLAPNPTEENSFFGLPLLALTVACFVLLWRRADAGRRAVLRALAVTAGVFFVLSLGPELKVDERLTGIPLPYGMLGGLPIFNAALPARLALVLTPLLGVLLAYALAALGRRPAPAWWGAFAVALLPLVPVPLHTSEYEPIPRFITAGTWREYVHDGGVLAPVPPTSDVLPDGQRWQTYALAHGQGEFRIPAGFFLGPGGPDGKGRIGPVPRPSADLLFEVARTGVVPPITEADRAAAREDLRYWGAEAVVLADRVHGAKFPAHPEALLRATTELLGPPQRVDDVWLWRV